MKFEKLTDCLFNTGRNILEGKDLLNDFNKNLMVKSVEDKKEEFKFDMPLMIKDVLTLFDLKIDTKFLSPTYIEDKLALNIKDSDFMPLMKGTKELLDSFTKEIDEMKTKIVGDSILIPEFAKDNILIKKAIEKIQDMIMNISSHAPGVKFIQGLNEYKEKLIETVAVSQKALDILNGDTLLDKNIFNLPQDTQKYFIDKRSEIIETSKKMIEDIESIAKNINQMNLIVDETNNYKNMFEFKNDKEIDAEVLDNMEQRMNFSNTFN